jgi:2,4-dienoyl-CoA reductase-like NADH-dependent reductase (Old Yellow Enzyme family)
MSSALFSPLTLAGITLPNRIAISPMCQYSALDGVPTDWHLMHLGALAMGGAAMLIIEATAVEAIGRISPADTGLYSDEQEAAFARVVAALRRWGTTPWIGLQLAHAGRKAATRAPFDGGGPLESAQGWQTVGASPVAFSGGWPVPEPLDRMGLARVRDAFVSSARRADRVGMDMVEVHAAHGYLLHQFLSPISNRRDDEYGGSRGRRMRFPLEVIAAIRGVWPRQKILGVRVSATDWVEGGVTLEDTIAFARELRALGCDYVCASSGGSDPSAQIPVAPGYHVPFAAAIRQKAEIATCAVGMIVRPEQAEQIVAQGQADLVAIARGFLDDPRWGWRAAEAFDAAAPYPPQYQRVAPRFWPGHKFKQR